MLPAFVAAPIASLSIQVWNRQRSFPTWTSTGKPAAILDTHGHSDHVAGNATLKHRWPHCPLVIGAGDAPKLADPWLNLSANFGVPLVSPPADLLADDGDTIEAADFDWQVRTIPGHTSGHVVYLGRSRPTAGVRGRRDLCRQHWAERLSGRRPSPIDFGIRSKLFTLPDETILCPATDSHHGGRRKETIPSWDCRPTGSTAQDSRKMGTGSVA